VSSDQSTDPFVQEMRVAISQADREILAAVNRRLELVTRLHSYKREHGYPIVDRSREAALLAELAAANPGPLSDEGLRELFTSLIGVTTREAAQTR
jgi:chorismate mutase